MACAVDAHEGQVTLLLELAILLVIILGNLEILELGLGKCLMARPLKLVGPSLVSEPVANEVDIAGIDEDGDLLKDAGNHLVVGLHPVTSKHKVAVDIKVAAVVAADLDTESVHDITSVEILRNVAQGGVAEVARVLTRAANIIDIKTSALVWAHHSVVTVDGGRYTRPSAAGFVAVLDKRLAARQSIIHGLTLALAEDRLVATFAASHGAVVSILSVAVRKTVADEDRLKIDIAVLVLENLGGENRDIVTGV